MTFQHNRKRLEGSITLTLPCGLCFVLNEGEIDYSQFQSIHESTYSCMWFQSPSFKWNMKQIEMIAGEQVTWRTNTNSCGCLSSCLPIQLFFRWKKALCMCCISLQAMHAMTVYIAVRSYHSEQRVRCSPRSCLISGMALFHQENRSDQNGCSRCEILHFQKVRVVIFNRCGRLLQRFH